MKAPWFPIAVFAVPLLAGCTYRIERGPRLEDADSELLGSEWETAALDAVDVSWARDQALAFFRAPVRRRLEAIPIYLSHCDSPELAGAYCQGGIAGLLSCGSSEEEIDLFYSPTHEVGEWDRIIDGERLRTSNPKSYFTATLWFSGIIHRRIHFPLARWQEALVEIRHGLRDVLVAIIVHEYFHALAGAELVDASAIAARVDDANPEEFPIRTLVASGRDAYPWWLILHRSEEAACLAAEYHLVFGYDVPSEVAGEFERVCDGRRGLRGPIVVRIPGDPAQAISAQPER